MKISVIITNWNGLPLIQKYLEKVIINSPEASEIIFSDDASTDLSVSYVGELQKKYPQLKIIKNRKNLGFSNNSNQAVLQSKGDYVVLLNNDIRPFLGYISSSIPHFKDPKLFGVGFAEVKHQNWARIFWADGYLQHERGLSTKTHVSAWVSGGSSIIRKEYFLKLGGFDEIYSPFYSEDLDLGYRAWKSGYKLLWEPTSLVDHKHESTMSQFPKRFSDYVKERNRLLNVWRNITNSKLLRSNRFTIISRCFFGPNYIKIILAARRQIKLYPPPIVFPVKTDEQIFEIFK